MQNEARQKNELKKQQMYNTDVFANKSINETTKVDENEVKKSNLLL